MIPQLISITLAIAGIIYSIVKNGEAIDEPKYPATTGLLTGCFSFFLYNAGGFWINLFPLQASSWPQVVIFVFIISYITLYLSGIRAQKRMALSAVPSIIAYHSVLFAGGFYDCFFK
jgi:hypothetical protein